MIPGFARVGEVASFLKELGTESACAFGVDDTNKPIIDVTDIIFRRNNLFHNFLAKSALRDCCAKNNNCTTNWLMPGDVLAQENPSNKHRNNWS